MFSMCSELTPHAHIPDTRIPQLMQPCPSENSLPFLISYHHWLGGTGNCLPQESEQGSGRVGVLLYHLARCWFHNCLRQRTLFSLFITHQLHQTSYLLAIDKEDKTARKSQFWVVEGRLVWYWRHPSTLKKERVFFNYWRHPSNLKKEEL